MKETNEENAFGRDNNRWSVPPEARGELSRVHSGNGAHHSARGGKIDAWIALDLLLHRWHWLVIGACVSGTLFYLLGWWFIKPKYTATAQLLRFETPGKSEFFKTTPISGETFSGLIRSPVVRRSVGEKLNPPVPPSTLAKWIKIDPEPDSDMLNVMAAARTPEYAVNFLNLYISNAVEYTRELDANLAATLANDYLKKEAEKMSERIAEVQQRFRSIPKTIGDSNRRSQVGGSVAAVGTNLTGTAPSMLSFSLRAQQLQTAMVQLDELLRKYKDAHPAVQAQRDYIKELQARMGGATNATAFQLPVGRADALNPDLDLVHIQIRSLEDARTELGRRQEEAELYASNPPASVRVFAPADLKTVKTNMRGLKISVVTIFGGMLGLGAGVLFVLLVEVFDNRLKTVDDLTRVTGLPVLATLGNLRNMAPPNRSQWAFRAWTMLQGKLSPSANRGLICGITSANSGEGRSTWISLLAEAASLSGFRVLTIATRPSQAHIEGDESFPDELLSEHAEAHGSNSTALTTSVLTTPAKATERLTGPNSQPVVHIPLPGWVWNLYRRKQWREALGHWGAVENLVILVELPPASEAEAVLLGSNLPNLVWLARSGIAEAGDTRGHLETLRNARCNLVGAVLNHDPGPSVKMRFPRWLAAASIVAAFAGSSARGQDATSTNLSQVPANVPIVASEPSPAQTNVSFAILRPSQRAAWQRHLTLGPGDVLNLGLFGQPDPAVGPDGRISFLEAQDVLASGQTIDELRTTLDQETPLGQPALRASDSGVSFRQKIRRG